MFKIAKLEAFAISVPLTSPVVMSGIVIPTANNLIVRIEDTDGIVGWGESASGPTMTGETPEGSVAAAKFMGVPLVGQEIEDVTAIPDIIRDLMYGNEGAKSAVEVALLDIAGQKVGKPMYALFGEKLRDRMPVLKLLSADEGSNEREAALKFADEGYIAFKVKVGVKGLKRDIERAQDIRDALPTPMRVSADANQGYNRADAVQFAAAAGEFGLDFFEQPVHGRDLDGMRACADASSALRIGADEGFHSQADVKRHHENGAAHGGSLKPIKLGGPFEVMKTAKLMVGLDMRVNLS
ncbi:MAG: mandelate racemase/muconate lactonizing enzyme family protein, partial [Rhodospirillales bacterium]|nr:mandelate racemase/muconate lactonizing enzyme family protein [Rhodospirillales bacterium]